VERHARQDAAKAASPYEKSRPVTVTLANQGAEPVKVRSELVTSFAASRRYSPSAFSWVGGTRGVSLGAGAGATGPDAPKVSRVAVLRDPTVASGIGQLAAIQTRTRRSTRSQTCD